MSKKHKANSYFSKTFDSFLHLRATVYNKNAIPLCQQNSIIADRFLKVCTFNYKILETGDHLRNHYLLVIRRLSSAMHMGIPTFIINLTNMKQNYINDCVPLSLVTSQTINTHNSLSFTFDIYEVVPKKWCSCFCPQFTNDARWDLERWQFYV